MSELELTVSKPLPNKNDRCFQIHPPALVHCTHCLLRTATLGVKMAASNIGDDWEKEFESDLINKKCSFLKLMYDKNNSEQKDILRKIATGNKLDAKLWLQYIECTVNCKTNKEKQLQLLRMVNNCLSLLSAAENQLSEDSSFIGIHLQVIALKRRYLLTTCMKCLLILIF